MLLTVAGLVSALSAGIASGALISSPRAGTVGASVAKRSLARRPARIMLALPHPGDISYAVAQVRITGKAHAQRRGNGAIFSSRFGGLSVAAATPAWRKLRKSTRVYVVVSRVAHAASSLRNVYFFITRRQGRAAGPARAAVKFTIANATPKVGSFWVRGVDRHGNAIVFEDPSAISTALGNWSRYLGVLKIAHALLAAAHPKDVNGIFRQPQGGAGVARSKDGVRSPKQGLWTGGQHASADVHKVFELIFGTMGDPAAFRAAKESPLVPEFIAKDLNNPALASEWRQVMAVLPLEIPDAYAAAAKEEAKFSTVHAPRITRATVAIADAGNAGSQAAIDSPSTGTDPTSIGQRVALHFLGSGEAAIYQMTQGQHGDWQPIASTKVSCTSDCSYFYPTGTRLEIDAPPWDSFQGWQGCNGGTAGATFETHNIADRCYVAIGKGQTLNVYGRFGASPTKTAALNVSVPGSGSGTVTSSPAGISCPGTCSADFPLGQSVTLTASAAGGSSFWAWNNCDAAAGTTCKVQLSTDKTVSALFMKNATLQVSKTGSGSGEVTSIPAGIHCGGTCSSSYPYGQQVVLTANSDPGSTFTGWSGDCAGTGTCTLSMAGDHSATATFSADGGELDPSFGDGGIALTAAGSSGSWGANGLARQSDGKFVVGGTQTDSSGNPVVKVARYNSNGTLDTSFGSGGVVTIPATTFGAHVLQNATVGYQASTGDVIVAGELADPANASGPGDFGVLRLKGTDGSVDTSFAGGKSVADTSVGAASSDYVNTVLVDPSSGAIYVGGSAQDPSTSGTDLAIAAYDASGQLEDGSNGTTAFGKSGTILTPVAPNAGSVQALAFDGSKLLAAGTEYGSSSAAVVMRYTSTGAPDPSFDGGNAANPGTPQTISSLGGGFGGSLAVASGEIVVGGSSLDTSTSNDCMALGALTESDGSADRSFKNPTLCLGQDAAVDGLAASSDGNRLYAAGYEFDGTNSHVVLAAYSSDGTADTGFGSSAGTPGYVISDPNGPANSASAHAVVLDGGNPVLAGDAEDGSGGVDFWVGRFIS